MWCAWRSLIICVSLPILVKALKCEWNTAKRAGVTEQALSLLYRDGFEKVETGVLVYKVGVATLLFMLLSLHKRQIPRSPASLNYLQSLHRRHKACYGYAYNKLPGRLHH